MEKESGRPNMQHFDSVLEIIAQAKAQTPNTPRTPGGSITQWKSSSQHSSKKKKLNAFKGVFVPTLQNILGIILFVRVPLIVGYAGIGEALAIIFMSCIATLLTSISMSAVATNGVPKSGGAYSIIKSSLGIQFGGVTGLLLFTANIFGCSMYILGAVEVLRTSYAGIEDINERLLGTIILLILTIIVLIGISYIARFAVLFLAGVFLALLSIWFGVIYTAVGNDNKSNIGVTGFSAGNLRNNFGPRYCDGWNFASLLGLFFPSCTDPLAGSNLSGDLRDPQAAIPIGTISAVLLSMVIFTIQVVLVAGASGRRGHCGSDDGLRGDTGGAFVIAIGWPLPFLVELGILVSTLGAGLQSLAGAPRLLSALAVDRIFPILDIFAPPKTTHVNRDEAEPRRAVILCAFLTCCCVMMNDLDMVAPFITLFFLTCYAIINGAAAFMAYEKAPNFRPTFRFFEWRVSIIGALLCIFIMFTIAPLYATAVLALSAALYKYVETQPAAANITATYDTELAQLVPHCTDEGKSKKKFWSRTQKQPSLPGEADWRASVRFRQARKAMLSLTEGDLQFKYWRPFVLYLCKLDDINATYQPQGGMLNLIQQLTKGGHGIALVSGVLLNQNKISKELAQFANECRFRLSHTLRQRKIEGFADVIISSSIIEGNRLLIQSKGMGVFRPNAVALGWPSTCGNSNTRDDPSGFCQLIEDASTFGKTVLVCKGTTEFPDDTQAFDRDSRIDIWWIYDLFPANGLLLLIPFLLQKNKTWKKSKLRLVVVSENAEEDDELNETVRGMLKAGGVIADLLLLHVAISDAPRFAHRRSSRVTETKQPNTVRFADQVTSIDESPPDDKNSADEDNINDEIISVTSLPSPMLRQDSRVQSNLDWDEYAQPSKLVNLVSDNSTTAELVVMPLPHRVPGQTARNWITSVDTLIADLRRVIFVKETGEENIRLLIELCVIAYTVCLYYD